MNILVLVFGLVLIFAVVGYVLNIVKLVKSDDSTDGFVLVLRVVGIFFPAVGAIMGYVNK